MDPYHMQLPGFSESQRLNCSDPLNHDLCSDMRDMMYAGLNSLDMDPSPSATDIAMDTLEDNLDALSLYSVKDCDSAKLLNESDSDSQPSLHGKYVGVSLGYSFAGLWQGVFFYSSEVYFQS